MTCPLVVYGAYINGRDRIVAATVTKKAAWEAMKAAGLQVSYHWWSQRACPTKNTIEVSAALRKPGVAVVLPQ